MKWLLDLIWPKAPVTMEEVGSSRADVPVENLKAPAWKEDYPRSTVVKELLVALHEAGDNQRATRLLMSLVAAFQQVDVPLDTATLFGPMGNGDYFVTFARANQRLTFTVCVDEKDSGWHSVTDQSYGRSVDNGPLPSKSHELVKVLLHHLGAHVATDAEASKWRPMLPPGLVLGPSDTMTVVVGPTVPEVDSLLRQVVSLREEVARVKVEAMGAITEARYENARYHADERGERDALRSGLLELKALVEPMCVECRRQSVEQLRIADRIERMENTDGALVKSVIEHCHRLERVEASAKREMDDHKKWKEQNLYEMMQTENRVTMMDLRYGIAIEALEKANDDKEVRLKQIEASFPVGWSTSAWYTKKAGDVWLNVSDRRTGWYVSVTSAREDQNGCLESGPHETMGEAIESAERLGKQLCVEMEDRTVIAGAVVKQQCSQVDGGKRVGIV